MQRHGFYKAAILVFLISDSVFAQKPDLTAVHILTHPVSENIHMLEASGDVAGNVAVLSGPEGILLVDTQFSELSDSIRGALADIDGGPIEFIVNTHYHDDHADGNAGLRDPTTTIIATENARKRSAQRAREARADITFDSSMSLFINGEEVKLIHLPNGHTDTDVVVYFKNSGVLHLGDLYNAGISSFPNVDLEAGGTLTGLVENIGVLIKMVPAEAKIIPGHYELSNLDGLKACHKMLVDTIRFVKEKKEAGITLEAIKKGGFPEKYRAWGQTGYTNAEAWIENIYRGLEEQPEGKRSKD